MNQPTATPATEATLAQDDVIAIQGTPSELRALAARITAVATAASARLDLAVEAG